MYVSKIIKNPSVTGRLVRWLDGRFCYPRVTYWRTVNYQNRSVEYRYEVGVTAKTAAKSYGIKLTESQVHSCRNAEQFIELIETEIAIARVMDSAGVSK